MVTISYAAEPTSNGDAHLRHAFMRQLLQEADALGNRPGVTDVLALVQTAVDHDTLTPEVAFSLGQQLRLVAGSFPCDDDLDASFVLQALLSELIELTSLVDGVHVDDLDPLVEHLVATDDLVEARRLVRLADAARVRVRVLESTLADDLRAA